VGYTIYVMVLIMWSRWCGPPWCHPHLWRGAPRYHRRSKTGKYIQNNRHW